MEGQSPAIVSVELAESGCDMSDASQGDDRSMSEILSSIRRIVTDEERSRREADDERRRREGESGASVLVLSEPKRPESPIAEPVDTSKPLELGAAQAVSTKPAPASVDFTEPGLSEEDIEDIVRRIVREELQGPIGQQISRKVKRLIRDEVHAALSEEELT